MSRRRILVVEDDPLVRRFTRAQLQSLGFAVEAAACVKEAFDLLETISFDLVFSDVVMPGQSGIELLRALRARGSSLKVLLMSGYSDEEFEKLGWQSEAELLRKPFRRAELEAVLARVLDEQPTS